VRQLALWLRQEGIDLPIAVYWSPGAERGSGARHVTIRFHRLLTNPVYAGAYVFGRTGSRARFEAGRKVITHGVVRPRGRRVGGADPRPPMMATSHGRSMIATRRLSQATRT